MERYLPTGNEQISIPRLNEVTAAIEDITFLYMACRGLLDLRGGKAQPLMQPFVEADGTPLPLQDLCWRREAYWVPAFTAAAGPFGVEGVVLAPVGERGFAWKLRVTNRDACPHDLQFGLQGCWHSVWHCVNEDKEVAGTRACYRSAWNNSLIFEMCCGLPLFAFAPMSSDPDCVSAFADTPEGITYRLAQGGALEPGQTREAVLYWGFGYEEVAAATSAKEMLRQGWAAEWERTSRWLAARSARFADPQLTELYNTNLFFCLFFSTGITLDTEEFVMVTSRSPRYYVSAAYWDRDSLLWSFPAVLQADPTLARRMLGYVFGRQRRNIGVHSRFIDGTVLEPGFELDELMAPLLALERYADATGDTAFLHRPEVEEGVAEILGRLAEKRHPAVALYETFLQPTDDERVYPYLTYDNVLVWRGLRAAARFYSAHTGQAAEAEAVRAAIRTHCVKTDADGAPYFAWSVDLQGHSDVYDEPPGSLQLLPLWGFCDAEDPVYQNTVRQIRAPGYAYSFAGSPIAEIGCPHAPHPWLLSVANSLLCGRVEHSVEILRRVQMDNGIACESVDEVTGECTTGEAFATCAGFLCYALRTALEGEEQHKE